MVPFGGLLDLKAGLQKKNLVLRSHDVNVCSVQSGSNAAEQGELVSRIKSLESENQSLYKGLCIHFCSETMWGWENSHKNHTGPNLSGIVMG